MDKGLNMQHVKNENRALVLYLLNAQGRLSRKEIAARLSLTPAAVTKICAELIHDGLIAECEETADSGKSGRREIPLRLCLKDKLGLGVSADRDVLTLSVFRLNGEALLTECHPICEDTDDAVFMAKAFMDNCGYAAAQFVGAGICIVGSQEEQDFGIWKDEQLKQKFSAALGLPVAVENNVKAFAQSELIYGTSKKNRSVLFFKWGPGVGSAIVADGKVYSGSDASVTEIGHYIVTKGGKQCRCGRFGCLETEASEEAIQQELKSELSVNERLKNPDSSVINILEHKIDIVALALANTATILNTESVVFFGSMFNNDFVAQSLKKQCLRYNNNLGGEAVTLSALNDKSGYIGAAAICAKHFFFEKSV